MTIKSIVLDLLEWMQVEQRLFVDSLTPEQKSSAGSFEHWSARDLVAHIAAWNAHMLSEIDPVLQHLELDRSDDLETINAGIYAAHRDQPFSESCEEMEATLQNLIQRVNQLSEAELTDSSQYPWTNERALWNGVIGNAVIHAVTHLSAYRLENGDAAEAGRLQDEMARRLTEIDPSPNWQGLTAYNLACFKAQLGDKEAAIQRLREALLLRPDLQEWSRQDPDLLPLHGSASYEALYGEG